MKTHTIILLALIAGLASGSVAQAAKADEEAYLRRQSSRPVVPVPVSVVSPTVGKQHVGSVVEVIFTVDKDGRPRGIRSLTDASHELVSRVVYAVSRWKFEPARDLGGNPKAVEVLLPVHIVDAERQSHGLRASR